MNDADITNSNIGQQESILQTIKGATMKKIILLLSLATALLASDARFEYFTGMDGQHDLPPAIEKLIREFEGYDDSFECTVEGIEVDLNGDGSATDFIATRKSGCNIAASASPVWVIKHEYDTIYTVVLGHMTSSLDILWSSKNRYSDIKTQRGTASCSEMEFWRFNGYTYIMEEEYRFENGDEETCRKYPDLCPWVMD